MPTSGSDTPSSRGDRYELPSDEENDFTVESCGVRGYHRAFVMSVGAAPAACASCAVGVHRHMKRHLKTIAARLPKHWQQELKRVYFRRQVRRRRFGTWEPEYALLPRFVARGDWVLDVGANVGHYTLRAAELVGTEGRVIALEPVPDTFALLAANAAARSLQNVTLINAAASASGHVAGMNIP